jgi:hypothetical protein
MDNLLTKVKTNNRILNQQSRLGQETEMKNILKTENEIMKIKNQKRIDIDNVFANPKALNLDDNRQPV